MQYFHYTYEHGALKWNSHVYKIGTYHYNWHREPEILVLLKGRLELSCHGQAYEMNPLDVAIISPQMGHATLALEPDTIGFVLHFSVHSISELDSQFQRYQYAIISNESNRYAPEFLRCRQYMAQMMQYAIGGLTTSHRLQMEAQYSALLAHVYNVITHHEDTVIGESFRLEQDQIFTHMIAYIDEHFQEPIDLEDLARIGGYNRNYASQFFKKHMGLSFVEYVLRLRLREVAVRLVNSDESIGHIAIQCGFPDIKAFNMAFKKHFSMTPSAYRDHVKRFGTPTRIHNWKQMVSVDDADTLALLASMVKEDSMVETLVDDTYKKKYEALQAAIAKLQDI